MSTALLQSACDFGLKHSTFRSSGTNGITGNGSSVANSTGDKLLHHSAQAQLPSEVANRMTGIYQTASGASAPPQQAFQTQHHKMSGAGVRRTVSSATPSTVGLSRQLSSTSTKVPLSNTQSSQSRLAAGTTHQREPHKKLDRSFSEPAEKKGSNTSSNSALGPSSRYKTELCRSFAEVGSCKYGDKCQFAHGDEELRTITRHPKFKTENCKSFHSTGFCPYGPRCHFIHNNDEPKKMLNTLQQSTPVINQRIFDQPIGSTPATSITGSLLASPGSSQVISSLINSTARSALSTSNVVFNTTVTSSSVPNAGSNLVRPKALSLGSYSLGSSGEMSSPSSHSGSPTSLNSFFTEDIAFGLGSNLAAPGSHLSAFTPHPNSAFSFSPDSAFVSFTPGASSGSAFMVADQTKCVLGGSQPTLNSRFSPEPTIADETANSVISSLFGGSPTSSPFAEAPFIFRSMSPSSKSHLMAYPSSPESPVDSVASEIEALKLGEQPTSFSPISSSFSTSSMSASSASPPNGLDLDAFALLPTPSAVTNSVNIPRLPTFAKFTTNANGHTGHRHLGSVGSSSPGSPQGSLDSMLE